MVLTLLERKVSGGGHFLVQFLLEDRRSHGGAGPEQVWMLIMVSFLYYHFALCSHVRSGCVFRVSL